MNARRVCMLAAVILCSGSLLIASAADKPQAKVGPTSVKDVMVSGPSNLAQTSATPDLTANTAGIPAKVAPDNTGGANPRLVDTNQGTQVPWTPATPSHGFAYGARGVGFDGSPGTDAPPALLSGFPMTPFPTDARPVGTEVTDIPVPAPCSGVIAIDSAIPITRRAIGSGWNSWSHGYTGDVYTFYEDPGTVTLTMPEDVCGLYFYVEPNTYDVFDVTCIANLGLATEVSSGPLPADGQGGAIYFGFFASAPDHIETITITVDTAANGWAVGEFGIVCGDECVVAPVACCFESTATCHDQYDLTQCIAEGGRYELGVEFCADMDPACGALIGACCAGPDAELYEPWECIGDMTQVECYALPEEDTNWTYGESCAGSPPFDCNAPTYCDVTYTNCGDRTVCEMGGAPDDWIMNVTFAEINNTTDTEPCPDSYGDYTDQVAYVAYGVTYNLSVQFCSEGAYTQYVTAWIDWNGDKTFDEETERYDLGSGVDATLTMDITVPPTAMPGYTRMRVIEEYNSAPDDACAGATYGETEDYTLLISGDIPVGSCCDPYTGICADNVAVTCCPDGHDWSMDSCADRVPACGNPGACCDITTGECQDGVLELLCEGGRFEGGEECEELEPPCGTPGACCYDEEQALCDIRFEANCDGRFLAGATCDPEEWEALGYPACGDWTCSGILYAPSNADNVAFRDEITALLGGGQVCDYWDSRASIPTLEDLQDYCCVFVWGNAAFADAVAYGDVLADYVDAGGKVMLGQWCIETTQNNWLEGRIMTEAYCPVTATGYGADSYVDGSGSSPVFMDVHTLEGDYFDQCTALPSALSDGLLAGGNIAAAWRPDNAVYYLPGATAPDLTSGDLAQLIVNACAWGGEPAYGACCDPTTGTCTDDVLFTECDGQFVMNGTCADDFPNCGDRGACCNPYDGTCTDEVLALDCPAGYRHEPGEECEELEPICGTPGACCYDEEQALCDIRFEANCDGRFLAGATCDPEEWEALGYYACGDWTCDGILYAPSNADNAAFRDEIAALLGGGQVCDYWDSRASTPTLEDLQDYCCVFVWGNYAFADAVAYGDVLADYVDAGGKVMLGQWCIETTQNNWLEGRIMTEAYCPVTATGYGADSYVDGSGSSPVFMDVHTLEGDYFDQCTALPSALSDGLLAGGNIAAAWRPDNAVYYLPGAAAPDLTSGDLAQLIVNACAWGGEPAYGACCDPTTGTCTDDVLFTECDGQFVMNGTCADDFPNCGDRGACCNPYDGTCTDEVLALDCPAGYRHEPGEECEELEPICGTPGACCDEDAALCTIEFQANCAGRFIAGATCDPDPWEALGQPACGDWECEGLLYAPSNADDAALRADIAAIAGCAVDYYDPRAGTPTLADIQDYCAIYTWVNYAYSDTVGFGDVLADFVDGGGKVILGQWCVYTGQNNWLEGRIMTESYCPITASSRGAGSYVDGSGTDCIFCNFHSLTGDYFDYCTAIAGAMFDGELNTGDLAAAWRADRRVYYVPGATPLNTGDLAQLIANIYGCVGSSAIGACCDPATGVCTDGVDCASCDGQFAIGGTCADDFPNCGNPGACCDDSAAVCTTEFEVNCPPGHRFLAGVACDPDPWEALGLDACGDYDACEHSITLWDDYGDGWNGNYIDVYVDGALILEGVTIASGAGPETVTFDAGTGSVIETVYTFDPGMWPYENSYCIYSGVGEELICDGMDGVDPTGVTTTGNCEAGICGDGACMGEEDVCNCPEDCGAYECPTQAPNAGNGIFSDIGCDSCTGGAGGLQVLAENFFVCDGDEIEIDAIGFWGGYYPNNTVLDPDLFTVIIKADDGAAAPGTAIATFGPMAATTKAATGVSLFGVDEYAYTIDFDPNVTLTGGTYWIEIYNDTSSMTDDWFWEAGDLDTVSGIIGQAFSFYIPEEPWSYDSATDMAIDVICVSGKMSPKADPRLDRRRESRRTLDAAPVTEPAPQLGTSRR